VVKFISGAKFMRFRFPGLAASNERMLTLHDLRWAHAAGRAAMWLCIFAVYGVQETGGDFRTAPPQARTATQYRSRNGDLVVSVGRGATWLGSRWCRPETIEEEFLWLRAHNPGSRVVLRVDRNAPFGDVRRVIVAAQASRCTRVTIDIQQPEARLLRWIESPFSLDRDRTKLIERDDRFDFAVTTVWK
jgi:biopolymer transport protein ExbD